MLSPASAAPLRAGAVILAGGRSSRMGHPKAWLPWRGRPLLLHLLDLLARRCAPLVVVGAPGDDLPPLPTGALRVDDPPGERHGPLPALALGLRTLAERPDPPDLAYLAACDGVFLRLAHVDHLLARLRADPALGAIIPVDPPDPADPARRLAHPLASAVRLAPALAAAERLLAAGARRPLALFDALPAAWIDRDDLPDPRVLRPCNTPDDYAAALAEAGDGPDPDLV